MSEPGWKRNGRNGPFDWWLACEHHGYDYQRGCMSCGMAEDHNIEFQAKLNREVAPPSTRLSRIAKMHDDYKPLDTPHGLTLERCPVCGSEGALWQYSTSPTAPTTKAVMCGHGDAIGPQDGVKNEGCLLYMPPDNFYRATIKDAVRHWNEFAKALTALRAQIKEQP